jgi:Ca-activated chloride channel family protein
MASRKRIRTVLTLSALVGFIAAALFAAHLSTFSRIETRDIPPGLTLPPMPVQERNHEEVEETVVRDSNEVNASPVPAETAKAQAIPDKTATPAKPVIENPVLKDAEITGPKKTDSNEDYESSKAQEGPTSGKPFRGKYWNSAMGVGGGSGRAYGGRFGGRRSLRSSGGGGRKGFESNPRIAYPGDGRNTEEYNHLDENPFFRASETPLSTFSIDVDTASYANVRRYLSLGRLPPKDAVRIEELMNYFHYDYTPPAGEIPFAAHVETSACPWNPAHRLVRIGIKGKVMRDEERPASNLVFLIDVSGSMGRANKLPLLVKALKLLVQNLNPCDRVAIVVYAGASGLVLPSTGCDQKDAILASLGRLRSGGSTNGGAGIRLAYEVAVTNFIGEGNNRVILATDGDFNVGVTNHGELVRIIEEKAKTGVFLSVLGFGMGNYSDARLESISNKGNGNFAYIDNLSEARKVLVEQMGGTLHTIAKDVKIQVEFNPGRVEAYRLIGYKNRMLRKEDFNDDKKDAGEIGAGHTVTALYEVMPAGGQRIAVRVDPLKYQAPSRLSPQAFGREMLTLKIRHKLPKEDKSRVSVYSVADAGTSLDAATVDFRFAAAVAAFGMLLRDSKHKGAASWDMVARLALENLGPDLGNYRKEFLKMVEIARRLK